MTADLFDTDVLALGEPAPGEPAFPQLRNRLFAEAVAHGFRSIALDAGPAWVRAANAFGRGEPADGFGCAPADRDLLRWMRAYNDGRPAIERLSVREPADRVEGTFLFAANHLLRPLKRADPGRVTFVAGSLGASPILGLGDPPVESFEGRLRASFPYAFIKPAEVPPGTPRPGTDRYEPLDAATLEAADAVLHVPTGVAPSMLAARIRAIPGVEHQEADGDLFFFVGAERMRPFATIVHRDVPGFDELSELHRPGVYRLNVDLGRREFERRFGFPPKESPEHHDDFDFARTDEIVPHPGYGVAAWASIVMPSPWRLREVDELIAHARHRHTRPARAS